MADNNIALGVQVPDAMKSISGMLNFAGQAQQLQNSRQQYQLGNVELQKNEIQLGERKGIQDLFRDPTRFTGEDGQPDYNKLINEGMKVAPTTFPTMVPQIIQAHTASIAAKSALNTLDNQSRDAVGQFVMSLGGDTPEVAKQKLDALSVNRPQLKPAIDFAWNYNLAPNAADPAKWKTAVLKVGQATMTPSTQADAMTPSYTSTGGEQVQTKPLAAAAGAPEKLPNTLSPGSLETVEVDAQGNKSVVSRSPQGTVLSTRAMPTQGAQDAPTPPVWNLPPGDREAIPVLEGERAQARNILSSAPIAHTTNQGILEEIDKVTTGSLGPKLQGLFSTLGAKYETAEERASAYDLVGKYLERNAIEAAKSMGPHTNAGLESAIKANGSLSYNPTAIKKLTKLNDAIVSGAELYQPGLEAAISANPQRGVLAKREFDQTWAQNFDPRIMMIERASKTGDKGTIEEIKKQAGAEGVKELIRKAGNLDRLSKQGRL